MRKEYKILLTASLLANLGDNLIGPFYAVFVEKIGGSVLDMGYTVGVFCVCTGILMFLVGKLSDKINKELITVFGYGFYALGTLFYLFISKPWQLFVLQIIFAFGTACLSAPLTALFARYIQKKKEGLQWGIEGGSCHVIAGLAVFLGTAIVHYWGFRILFLLMFIIQVSATIIQTKMFVSNSRE